MSKTLTITDTYYHHLSDGGECPVVEGQTVRQAMRALRGVGRGNFGDIGGLRADVSDGSELVVALRDSGDGNSRLMSSQRIIRRRYDAWSGRDVDRVFSW